MRRELQRPSHRPFVARNLNARAPGTESDRTFRSATRLSRSSSRSTRASPEGLAFQADGFAVCALCGSVSLKDPTTRVHDRPYYVAGVRANDR